MTEQEALELLQQHNRWRRGDDSVEMAAPRALGLAIDVACRALAEQIEHEKEKPMTVLTDTHNVVILVGIDKQDWVDVNLPYTEESE